MSKMSKLIKYIFLVLASIVCEIQGLKALCNAIEYFMIWWLFDGDYIGKVLTSYSAVFSLIIGLSFVALPVFLPWGNKDKGKNKDKRRDDK